MNSPLVAASDTPSNFIALSEAEIGHALARAQGRLVTNPAGVHEVVGPTVASFIAADYPGVPHDCDPDEYQSGCERALWNLADQVASEAGFDTDDPAIQDEILDEIRNVKDLASEAALAGSPFGCREEEEARAAFEALASFASSELSAPVTSHWPGTPKIVDISIICRMVGRAPRIATNTRTRGSRRCSASRGDPDDLADPPGGRLLLIGSRP